MSEPTTDPNIIKDIPKDENDLSNISLAPQDKLDPDFPNFTSTKRLSTNWRTMHFLFHLIFSLCFISFPIVMIFQNGKYITLIYIMGSIFKLICTFMEWWHYKRGCCGDSNLNSKTKTNIDKSFKAEFNRAKTGLLYFMLLLISAVIFVNFLLSFKQDDTLFTEEKSDSNFQITNIIFMSGMIGFTVIQILKFERIATPTKQYQIENDISNFFVEWFILIGCFIYSLGLIDYIFRESDLFFKCKKMHVYCSITGGGFFICSVCAEYFRFFCSDDSDLNLKGETDYSI
jgi:hypothetical protein